MALDIQQLIKQVGGEEGVDPTLINAIMQHESNYDVNATSPKGAAGPMQLMPATAKRYGLAEADIYDTEKNVRAGTKYLRDLNKMFNGDVRLVAAAYNAGEGAVLEHRGVPPYPETQVFSEKVARTYARTTPLTPLGPVDPLVRQQVAKTDARQPLIDEELRLRGKTRADLGPQMDDPEVQSGLFKSALTRAEALDPKLNLRSGLEAYRQTLAGAGPGAGQPAALPAKVPEPPTPQNFFPRTIGQVLDVPWQVAKGLTIDNFSGIVGLSKDIVQFGEELTGTVPNRPEAPTLGGVKVDLNGKSISHILDEYLAKAPIDFGEPKTGLAHVGRSLAGFIQMYGWLKKAVAGAPGAIDIGNSALNKARELSTNTTLFGLTAAIRDDPNSQLWLDWFDDIARRADPEHPERVREIFVRSLTGDIDLRTAKAQLAQRLLHGTEGSAFSLLLDSAFAVIGQLRAGRAELTRVQNIEKLRAEAADAIKKSDAERAASHLETEPPRPMVDREGNPLTNRDRLSRGAAENTVVEERAAAQTAQAEVGQKAADQLRHMSMAQRDAEAARLRDVRDASTTAAEKEAADAELTQFNQRRALFEQQSEAARTAPTPEQIVEETRAADRLRMMTQAQRDAAAAKARDLAQQSTGTAGEEAAKAAEESLQRSLTIAANQSKAAQLMDNITQYVRSSLPGIQPAQGRGTGWINQLMDQVEGDVAEVKATGKPSKTAGGRAIGEPGSLSASGPPARLEPGVSGHVDPWMLPNSIPEDVLKGADDLFRLLDQPIKESGLTAQMHAFLTALRSQFGEETGRSVTMALLQGGLGVGAAQVYLNSEEGGPDDYSRVDQNLMKGAALLFGLGFGGRSFRGAVQALKEIRAGVAPELQSAVRNVVLAPAARQRLAGQSFLGRSSGATHGFFGGAREYRFELVNDAGDMRSLVTEASNAVSPRSGSAAGVALNDNTAIARRLGVPEGRVESARNHAATPEDFTKRAAGLVSIAQDIPTQLRDLAQRYRAGEPVGSEMLRMWNIAGTLGDGFNTTNRTFGAAMDRFRGMGYGEFTELVDEGTAVGTRQPSGMTTDRLARWITSSTDDQLMSVAYQRATTSGGQAIVQAFLSSILATPTALAKVVVGNSFAIGRELTERGLVSNGLQTSGLRKLLGAYEVGSPEVGEVTAGLQAIQSGVLEGLQAGLHTAITGRTQFAEIGATHSVGPAFTREAFPRAAEALDAAGEFVGLSHAGNVFSWLGNVMDVLGSRPLVVGDELSSFFMERANLAMRTHRFIAQGEKQGLWANQAEADAAIAAFKQNLPEDVVKETRRLKMTASFMNDLLDPIGAYSSLRHATAGLQSVMVDNPVARIHFPFLRAMSSMFTQTIEGTPLAYGSASFRAELRSADPAIRAHAEGRMMLAWTLATTFASAGALGIVNGKFTNDKNYREELARAGKAENSVYLGGTRFGLDTTQPLGWLTSFFATLGTGFRDDSSPAEINAVHGGLLALGELLRDQTFLGVIARFAIDLDDRTLTSRVERGGVLNTVAETIDDHYLRSVIPPRLVTQFNQVLNPYRPVYDNWLQHVESRVPILSNSLPQETDIFGRPRYLGGGLSSSRVDNGVRVITGVPIESIPVDTLSKGLKDKGVIIHDPPATFEAAGITVPLERHEQQRLREWMSQPPGLPPLQETIMAVMNTPFWKQASAGPDGEAQLLIREIVSKYTEVARAAMFAENQEVLTQRILAKGQQTRPNLFPQQ